MLDILRGIAVIGMVFHHALVSYEIVFWDTIDFLYTDAFTAIQLVFVAVFLLVSGICTRYSRNVLKRGLIVCAAAVVVSLATCVVLPAFGMDGLQIYFGVLHMFGLSMVIYALTQKLLDKIPTAVGITLFTVLYIGYYAVYATSPAGDTPWLLIFGVLPRTMTAYGDYYPLLPYMFLFIAGGYLGRLVFDKKFPERFYTARCKPLELCGRYSLYVYVLHQPVIFGILMLISYLK